MNTRITSYLFFVASIIVIAISCKESVQNERPLESRSGEELSQVYCTSCHMYTEPGLLDKKTWKNHVLVRMGAFLGVYNDNVKYYDVMPEQWKEPGYGGQRVLEAKIYPEKPLITRKEWEKIAEFYLSNAPDQLLSPGVQDIKIGLPGFKTKFMQKQSHINPHITAISATSTAVYAGVYQTGLMQLNVDGHILDSLAIPGMIVDINHKGEGLWLSDIGSRYGRDLPLGNLYKAKDIAAFKRNEINLKWDSLQRPVHINAHDLDKDGDLDFVMCEYGYMLGQMCWYENVGSYKYVRHILHNDDGAIRTEIRDFDENGFNDIMVLVGNSDEGIDIYFNKDGNSFEKKRILRFLPTNGSTSFQLIDWDNDGDEDILYTEGDNGDYVPILKPHHGIRLFINYGNLDFKERFHLPMNGVYKAIANDFDLDGDMDIAAISFHPDFLNGASEGFVYFDNQGSDVFQPFSIAEVADGRWMCLDAADIDGDKDIDILIGAFDIKTPEVPDEIARNWEESSVPIILLENLSK